MNLSQYCSNTHSLEHLASLKDYLTDQLSLTNEISENLEKQRSAVASAMKLLQHGFVPGDIIHVRKLKRVRIENECMDGSPLGQPVDGKGVPHGRTFLLTDDYLATSRKL